MAENNASFSKSIEQSSKADNDSSWSESKEVAPKESPEKKETNLLLFVDVNLGPSRTERIIVYEGDTAILLADRFSKKYNLNPLMKQKLVELLNLEISGILERIDEENSENYSSESGIMSPDRNKH